MQTPKAHETIPLWQQLRAEGCTSAAEVLLRTGQTGDRTDVYSVAIQLGTFVYDMVGRSEWSGVIEIREEVKIYLTSSLTREARRFILAQQIGHLLLHKIEEFHIESVGVNPEDAQSYKFAMELLMPGEIVRKYAHLFGLNVKLMAELFDVQVERMQARIGNLALGGR